MYRRFPDLSVQPVYSFFLQISKCDWIFAARNLYICWILAASIIIESHCYTLYKDYKDRYKYLLYPSSTAVN